MLTRSRTRGLVMVAAVVAALVGLSAEGRSQEAFPGGIRIGLILPDPTAPGASPLYGIVGHHAAQGAISATEDYAILGEMMGIQMSVATATASGAAGVVAAAEHLVNEEGVYGIIGGYTFEEARALGVWAEARGIPFLNVGATEDSLRNELCSATTFHVEPSAAMYLDAMAGWYVRAGFRRWFVVQENSEEGRALHDRLAWALTERHFGVREVGEAYLAPGAPSGALAAAIQRSNADLVLLLLNPSEQLRVLADLDAAGVALEVAGFPYPEAQTRAFYAASRAVAPRLGVLHRAAAWEATIDAYGAREYNAFYPTRWGEPNEPAAWAAYHAVRVLFEAAFFGGSAVPAAVMAYMTAPSSVFDLHKGIAVSFRSWDRQMRQSLFLIKISETATTEFNLGLLVGELPAIYMPGTDPIERLDQLGDLENRTRCTR